MPVDNNTDANPDKKQQDEPNPIPEPEGNNRNSEPDDSQAQFGDIDDYPIPRDGGAPLSKQEQAKSLLNTLADVVEKREMLKASNERKTNALASLGRKLNARDDWTRFLETRKLIGNEFVLNSTVFDSACHLKHKKWLDFLWKLMEAEQVYHGDDPSGEVSKVKMNTEIAKLEYSIELCEHEITRYLNESYLIQRYFDFFSSLANGLDFQNELNYFNSARIEDNFAQRKWTTSYIIDEFMGKCFEEVKDEYDTRLLVGLNDEEKTERNFKKWLNGSQSQSESVSVSTSPEKQKVVRKTTASSRSYVPRAQLSEEELKERRDKNRLEKRKSDKKRIEENEKAKMDKEDAERELTIVKLNNKGKKKRISSMLTTNSRLRFKKDARLKFQEITRQFNELNSTEIQNAKNKFEEKKVEFKNTKGATRCRANQCCKKLENIRKTIEFRLDIQAEEQFGAWLEQLLSNLQRQRASTSKTPG